MGWIQGKREREESRSDPGFVAKAHGLGWERLGKSNVGERFGIWSVTRQCEMLNDDDDTDTSI